MQTKKRKMKAGEALVGMKRSGSQLETRENGQLGFANDPGGRSQARKRRGEEGGGGRGRHTFVSKT